MVAHRRRRELFPPDRRLQARMAVAAIATPLIVLAALVAVLAVLPTRLALFVAGALVLGIGGSLRAWRAGARRGPAPGGPPHPALSAAGARGSLLAPPPPAGEAPPARGPAPHP